MLLRETMVRFIEYSSYDCLFLTTCTLMCTGHVRRFIRPRVPLERH